MAIEQHFCDICSRGVILRREPVFKCRGCGRIVCRDCFNSPMRLCEECFASAIEEERRQRLLAEEEEIARRTEEDRAREDAERKSEVARKRVESLRWIFLVPLLFTAACWLVFHVLLSLPPVFWLTVALVHDVIFVITGLVGYPWKEDLHRPRIFDRPR